MMPETSTIHSTSDLAPAPRVSTIGSLLAASDRQIAAFDDRYGRDAHARLLARLARPCVSFAAIAVEFGVSRERVRQWRQQWAPEAPTGLERRRQCLATRRRRQLLAHPSFRSFYQEVRRHVPAHRLGLIAAQSGFRKRVVRIDDRVAVLTTGRPLVRSAHGQPPTYALPPVPAHAAFVYVQLGEGDYLFVPAQALPARGTTFVDTPASKYQRVRRTFAAIDAEAAS
jgi:transposase-like protein